MQILAPESVFVPGRETVERHPKLAADACVHVVYAAGVAMRWQPFAQSIGFQEGTIDPLW